MEKIKNIRKRLRHQRSVRRRKLGLSTPTQIICVSFIIVIALGTLLLTLPIASRHGRLDVLNAMFTATSATCVTGLVVRDTWTQFTWFGQAVVLLLFQRDERIAWGEVRKRVIVPDARLRQVIASLLFSKFQVLDRR